MTRIKAIKLLYVGLFSTILLYFTLLSLAMTPVVKVSDSFKLTIIIVALLSVGSNIFTFSIYYIGWNSFNWLAKTFFIFYMAFFVYILIAVVRVYIDVVVVPSAVTAQ